MDLKLYYAPGACSFVPHVLLEASGAPFEGVWVRLHRQENDSPGYRAINPRGQVPVLVEGGETITQILAIVGHLDARFPAMNFLPRETLERTRAMELLAWMNNTVHPAFTHVFMPQKFARTAQTQEEVREFGREVYRGLLAELDQVAARAAQAGRPWLCGEFLGPADAYALTLLRWGGLGGIDPTGFAALWAHVQRVSAQPPVARVMERERLQLNLYKSA